MSGEILDQIDSAVADWEVSKDAMRCNRDPDAIASTWHPAYAGPPPDRTGHWQNAPMPSAPLWMRLAGKVIDLAFELLAAAAVRLDNWSR